ncbi:Cytidylate kinase [Tessaracoccus sp. O5.2]|uniref:cytidylate kinase-like family protein n=1 Tax=Tessaracoccus sp. O5.2 TaxID=3157622 RepID=UPI000ACD00AD
MGAITVSRQLGSHGARIARGVAMKLGWPIADKSTINGVIKQYGLIHLDHLYGDKPPTFWDLFDHDSVLTIEWMNKTVQAIAAQGDAVILGRGGFAVLKDYADVLDVFIKAPDDVRAERISLRDDIQQSEAARKVAADDQARAKFTRLIYSRDWADEKNFDLVIDTGQVTDEAAMDQIIDAYRALMAGQPAGPRVADIRPDPVLADTVREQLARHRR